MSWRASDRLPPMSSRCTVSVRTAGHSRRRMCRVTLTVAAHPSSARTRKLTRGSWYASRVIDCGRYFMTEQPDNMLAALTGRCRCTGGTWTATGARPSIPQETRCGARLIRRMGNSAAHQLGAVRLTQSNSSRAGQAPVKSPAARLVTGSRRSTTTSALVVP